MRPVALVFASVIAAAGAGSCLPAAVAQQPAYPIEARLVSTLDTQALKPGEQILFTSVRDWKDGDCHLAQGATLHGMVISSAFGHGVKHENFALAFTYPCSEVGTFSIHWIALLAPDPELMKGVNDNPGNVRALRSEAFGEGVNAASTSSQTAKDPSGRGNPSVPLFSDDGEIDPVVKRPVQVHSGDVWQIPRVKLQVAAGPQQSSIASSTSGRLRLISGTVFILSVGQAIPAASVANPAAAPSAPAVRQRVNPVVPALERCSPPLCSKTSDMPAGAAKAAWTIPLAGSGYRQQTQAELTGLDYGAALAFLAPDQLLMVFDAHHLVARDARDRPEDRPHMMRAILFNVTTKAILKTMDFRVSDERQVMWQTSDGRVILHQGDSLCWYGPGLVKEKQLAIGGPLAFFSAAPDDLHFAVGTVHELHSVEEHKRLLDANSGPPEEQIEVRLFDAGLKQIFSGLQSSLAFAPVLLNGGSIELRIFKGDQFYFKERSWDGTSFRSFSRLASSCIPRVSGTSADTLLVEACSPGKTEHRVVIVREDGSPVLETSSELEQFPPLAVGDKNLFAVAILGGGAEYRRNRSFKVADLTDETFRVFRSTDGRLYAESSIAHPLASHQPIALSPDCITVAALDGQEIRGYMLTAAPR